MRGFRLAPLFLFVFIRLLSVWYLSQLTGFIFSYSEVSMCVYMSCFLLIVCVISVDLVVVSCSCQSDFPSVDHLAASAAHVVHCVIVLAYAGAKNWFIFVLVLAISSDFLGLPGFLPV